MAITATGPYAAAGSHTRTAVAVTLTGCTALLCVALIGAEAHPLLWSMLGLLAASAAAAAFQAGGGMPRHRSASASLVVSDLVLVTSVGYLLAHL